MNEHFINYGEVLATEVCNGNSEGFANSLTVWLNKPHVVNRRLCGSRLEYFKIISKNTFCTHELKTAFENLSLDLHGFSFDEVFNSQNISGTGDELAIKHDIKEYTSYCVEGLSDILEDDVAVIIRQLLPKQPERHANIPELVIYDKSQNSCSFIPLKRVDDSNKIVPLEVGYCFKCLESPEKRICLYASTSDCSTDSERKLSLTWIKSQLLQKLARWSEQPSLRTGLVSLRLISVENYSRLYSELKNKYGIPIAEKWPEKTSAQKYVFEDVAIATYLLLLWEDDRNKKGLTKKQSFVDLGCGNGLLVHILASEGHPGYGIDVRRRNIWDLYGPETILKEMTITPSTESVYPDSDWLIGNHSDELTPWIPVMAARSAYTCNYFVLPCCMWDFNTKYSFTQKVANGSENSGKYRLYLDFVKSVGENCGFEVEEDMLRIPSTKRVCFVGRTRTYPEENEAEIDADRQEYISSRCQGCIGEISKQISSLDVTGNSNLETVPGSGEFGNDKLEAVPGSQWVSDFTPRSKTEVTKNCVTVKKETKDFVTKTVFDKILICDNCEMKVGQDGRRWNKGGKLPVGQVAAMFDKEILQELKSECGGLQTLLRNSCHIFQVSGGHVQLRDFTLEDPFEGRRKRGNVSDKSDFLKTTLCWFHEHHPDGCPKSSDNCSYAHGVTELKPRPIKGKAKLDS